MIALVVVVVGESVELSPWIARQVVVFRHGAVFERVVPTLDGPPDLWVIRGTVDMIHLPIFQPIR
nr:hypothetical protein [Roseobacter cerasinus]